MEAIVDNTIYQGYTVAWDGDVSEKGFSQKNGLAIVPEDLSRKGLYGKPGAEVNVT